MDLGINNRLFIITGAGDGLGFAVAKALLEENAKVIAVSRSLKRMPELEKSFPGKCETIIADAWQAGFTDIVLNKAGNRNIDGIFINAGGPPAGTFNEIKLSDWDMAYLTLLRWKIELLHGIVPLFQEQHYGRIILSESISVKQPIKNLVLSNSLRAAVVGMAKTLAEEIAPDNVTLNIMAPGYHDTHAMQRLYENKMQNEQISVEKAKSVFESNVPLRRMGTPEEFGKFAAWLLSPLSGYLTGQTFSVDGGVVRGLFG